MNKHSTISFLEIESIPPLIKDFITQKIAGFRENTFTPENIENQFLVKEQSFSQAKRQLLSDVLSDQYTGFTLSEEQQNNLRLLTENHVFTVTTGHQLNLFTGPVFFIYKILQTIKTAEYLNQNFPGRKTVPVFWMATEDHDFAEINHFRTEQNYYETHGKSGGAVGRITFGDDLFVSEYENEFKDSVFGTELILMLKRAYKKGNSLAASTRILVQELFAEYGLLVLDGDDKRLKKQMVETFRNELLHHELFESTKSSVKILEDCYGKVQVNPREINLFYLTQTRDRIGWDGTQFVIIDKNTTFTKEEILAELETHPEKFSPNALMRPVYQETVLPNIAYIGGNAEIMYWMELKPYFEQLKLPFPMLVPRSSMLFVTKKTVAKAEKLGLSTEDFFKNFAEVTKGILLENNLILPLLNEKEMLLEKQFNDIAAAAELTDKSFGTLVQAEKTRQLKSFKRMRKRLLRAEKIKQREKLQRLDNLFLTIHPGKIWQERVLNFSVFYADHGREWLQSCYDAIDVAQAELVIVSI